MKLDSITAVVTGGASGLGAATSQALVEAGAHCLILDVDADLGSAFAASLGPTARFAAVDISDPGQVAAALDGIDGPPLRLLVNCAFVRGGLPLLDEHGEPHDLERFRRCIEVNLIGTFNTLRLAAARMARLPADADGERGVVINVASLAAYEGQERQTAYAASKAGVIGLMMPAARDLAAHGIRVMTIAPGTFATPTVMRFDQRFRDDLAQASLFPHRLGRPEEFAALVRHICENPFLNAEVIKLHAGTVLPVR